MSELTIDEAIAYLKRDVMNSRSNAAFAESWNRKERVHGIDASIRGSNDRSDAIEKLLAAYDAREAPSEFPSDEFVWEAMFVELERKDFPLADQFEVELEERIQKRHPNIDAWNRARTWLQAVKEATRPKSPSENPTP